MQFYVYYHTQRNRRDEPLSLVSGKSEDKLFYYQFPIHEPKLSCSSHMLRSIFASHTFDASPIDTWTTKLNSRNPCVCLLRE